MPLSGNNPGSVCAFMGAARRYWLSVFPAVSRERRHWQVRANEIPDPVLRRLALDAQHCKRGNVEGAAAFAAFVEPASRPVVVRALVAFQTAYDYADVLSEQPSRHLMRLNIDMGGFESRRILERLVAEEKNDLLGT